MLQLLLLCVYCTTITFSTVPPAKEDYFFRCPTTLTTGNEVAAIAVRSELECTALCASTDWCGAVQLHDDVASNGVTCLLRNDTKLTQCQDTTSGGVNQTGSYFVRKALATQQGMTLTTMTSMETTELVCQNGGVVTQGKCSCPLPFAGHTCERYIRDCTEAFELGHVHNYHEMLMIQPITSPSPFTVRCRLEWGGVTYPIRRSVSASVPWNSVNWNQIKAGFTGGSSEDLFIGLEKVHQILIQGQYQLQIFSTYNNQASQASAYYENFTIGPESSDYELSYSSFFWQGNLADNGLAGAQPKKFCTHDHDECRCGAWGWLGSDCQGFTILSDPPLWPVGGVTKQLKSYEFCLVRKSPFFE